MSLSSTFDDNIGTSKVDKKGCKDLKTRERVNFIVDSLIMKKLRMLSITKEIPMSRLVDQALRKTYNLSNSDCFSTILLVSHEIKLYIYKGSSSDEIKELLQLIDKLGCNYILGDCLLAQEDNRIVGSQINFFIKDGESKVSETCVNFLNQREIKFSLVIDDKIIQ